MQKNLHYRQYQQVLQITGNSVIKKKPARRSKRSFLGCMHCKRKKIKCDEAKPICKNCVKSKLECEWPYKNKSNDDNEIVLRNDQKDVYMDFSYGPFCAGNEREEIKDIPNVFSNDVLCSDSTEYSPIPGVKLSSENLCYYTSFIQKFVPSIAQPYDRRELTRLFISASSESPTLLQIFIACGATMLSFENETCKVTAYKKYLVASDLLLKEMKKGSIKGYEDWFFIAIQVMQSISLRNKFIGANANRCSRHLGIANKIMTKRLNLLQQSHPKLVEKAFKDNDSTVINLQSSTLDKVFRENYIFNYALSIFFCDSNSLKKHAPNPFLFFKDNRNQVCPVNKNRWYESRIWKSSNIAFEIAAKCSWSCRSKLPLSERDRKEHQDMLSEAISNIQKLQQIDTYTTSKENKIDITIAKLVTRSSIILLKKILNYDEMNANHFQNDVNDMISDIDKPYNRDAILPTFSLMIAASASISQEQRSFLRPCLDKLVSQLNSNMVLQISNYIKAVWELYENGDAFELLFKTDIMNQVCN